MLDDVAVLVPHLLRFTPAHRIAAREVQNEVVAFSREMAEAFDQVWPTASDKDVEAAAGTAVTQAPQESWAARVAEEQKERERAVKAIIKPELRVADTWRTRLVDVDATAAAAGTR
jgi:elongator complex protein 1